MIKVCLDTNAIIDICYRYYPKMVFEGIWNSLLAAVSGGMIKFVVSEDIYQEVYGRLLIFKNYSQEPLDYFFELFKVEIISKDRYGNELLSLQQQLIQDLPYFLNMKAEKRLKKVVHLNNDLSNVAAALLLKSYVLTSEQGFNKDISKEQVADLKIPDTCRYKGVMCYSWIELFNYLEITVP